MTGKIFEVIAKRLSFTLLVNFDEPLRLVLLSGSLIGSSCAIAFYQSAIQDTHYPLLRDGLD